MWLLYHILPITLCAVVLGWQGLVAILVLDAILYFLNYIFRSSVLSALGVTLLVAICAFLIYLALVGTVGTGVAIAISISYVLLSFFLY